MALVSPRALHHAAQNLANERSVPHLTGADISNGRFLVNSPYTSASHLLNLDDFEAPDQQLAIALTHLRATTLAYATESYQSSFNWSTVIAELSRSDWPTERSYFIVVFRSRIPPATSRLRLAQLDEASHVEATQSGGLLKYWFGTADQHGRNLATCVWRHKSDIGPASSGPAHREAIRHTRALYTEWKIERLRLRIGPHCRQWSIEDWVD